MARTRRTVENLAALMLSVVASSLLFGSLVMGMNRIGGSSNHSLDQPSKSVAVTLLQSDEERSNLGVIESATEVKKSVGDENYDTSDGSGDESEYPVFHDMAGSASSDYLPVPRLTQRPVVLQDIDPDLPESLRSLEPQTFYLTLFINEYGDVDQIKLASIVALPTFMLDELRRHFVVMRFIPGYLEGRAVRSALRIRVQLHP